MKFFDDEFEAQVRSERRRWLVTGAAGFIGSNITEALLRADQEVVGFDNFATGHQRNLDELLAGLNEDQRNSFHFAKADIRNREDCMEAVKGVDLILHQAALGSVPRSLADPLSLVRLTAGVAITVSSVNVRLPVALLPATSVSRTSTVCSPWPVGAV